MFLSTLVVVKEKMDMEYSIVHVFSSSSSFFRGGQQKMGGQDKKYCTERREHCLRPPLSKIQLSESPSFFFHGSQSTKRGGKH